MQFSGRDGEEKQQCSGIFFQISSCISKLLQYFVIKSLTSPCSGGILEAGDPSTAFSPPQCQEVAAFVQKTLLAG